MSAGTLSFIGLGSNVGDRLETIREASRLVSLEGEGAALSPIYETAPVGPPQADYLNAVLRLWTRHEPTALLERLLQIERSLGRERRQRWGPRTIDLDLLAVEGLNLHLPGLTVPHPEIRHRAFVLRPWLDLAPDFEIPLQGTVRSLWDALPAAERDSVRPFSPA